MIPSLPNDDVLKELGFEITHQHPMEAIFNLPDHSTDDDIYAGMEVATTDVALLPKDIVGDPSSYDERDTDIDTKSQAIYDLAMIAFQEQARMAMMTEPKFASRSMEVATQLLNAALAANNQRMNVKARKDKIAATGRTKSTVVSTTNNVLITGSRSEALRALRDNTFDLEVVDGDKE